MRIVHLNPFYFPYAGGIERRIRAVSTRLAKRHEVHVVTSQLEGGPTGDVEEHGFTVHHMPSKFRLKKLYNPPLVSSKALPGLLKKLAPELIDYHFRWSPSYNRAFRKHNDAARVVTYHNTYGEGRGALGWASRLNDRLYMRTLARADRVLCVSRRVEDDLVKHKADATRLRISHNAVERHEIEKVKGKPTTEIPGPFVVAVGRVVDVKGFDVLIRAWKTVPKETHLVIVGEGPARPSLQKRATKLGVASRVHFTGWVEEEEKIRLLKAAQCYAHPARFESFPFSLLEAMAAGAPVVAAGIGGVPEVVGDAGRLLGHDPKDWAQAVTQVTTDESLRQTMTRQSLARIQAFDWDRIANDLEAVYEEALDA